MTFIKGAHFMLRFFVLHIENWLYQVKLQRDKDPLSYFYFYKKMVPRKTVKRMLWVRKYIFYSCTEIKNSIEV